MEKKVLKSNLLNIDSEFRNLYPKNIYTTNGNILPVDPLTLTTGSNIVSINYPNHNLTSGDNIIIQNVVGISRTFVNTMFLINNFKYIMIMFPNNMIDINYTQYNMSLYINIDIVGSVTESNIINNIPFNNIIGYKKIILANEIPLKYINLSIKNIVTILKTFYNLTFTDPSYTDVIDYLNSNALFVELPTDYLNLQSSYKNINQVFKISYNHIGGIMLGYLNANYPISYTNYQSNYKITNIIDSNNFQITLNNYSYGNIKGGGKNVQVMKIINSITGYPDANNYVINLKKSFNNVVKIDLVSMEIPYVDLAITKGVNDKLYWKHIEDGNTVYSIQIDEGFYTNQTLLDKLKTGMNSVQRITSTAINSVYNNFDIKLESNNMKISFIPYNYYKLPNSFTIRLETINLLPYYILSILHPNNFVKVNDMITISGSNSVSSLYQEEYLLIDSSYINKDFNVYSVNNMNQSYDVIIGLQSHVKETVITKDQISNGGENIIIKTRTQVSFLFDKQDTMGDILGFINIGDPHSIINFNNIITNKDSYINSYGLDSVGNIISYSSGFINYSGKYTYILMYLNDIEYIYSNNNLKSAFAKILLNGNPGDILFDTFVENPDNIYSNNFPISTLTDITVSFIYPDGSPVHFRNINHSFTLKITEEYIENNMINLNSQSISYIEEFKKQELKKLS